MAQTYSVEINEPTPGEIEPEEKPTEDNAQQEEKPEKPEGEEQEDSRPEWLDERFKTPEDLAKSYAELEKKLLERQEKPETEGESDANTEEKPPETSGIMDLVTEASEEFFANEGTLTDETYQKLEQSGISRDLVDSFAKGQSALKTQFDNNIQAVANGEFSQMKEWMVENISDADLDTYNNAVNSGNEGLAKMAVESMYSRFKSNNPTAPNLLSGSTSGEGGVKPFQSMQEQVRAQSDPRYKSGDPAYHKEVDRRMKGIKY